MASTVALDDLRLLAVSGPDRVEFLQGQLTQDMARVTPAATLMAGWADAKGRLLLAGHLFSTAAGTVGSEPSLALLVPRDLADALARRLQLYVLRAKVQVTVPEVSIVGLLGEAASLASARTVQIQADGQRHLLLGPDADAALGMTAVSPRSAWQLADIAAGLPAITAATSGEFVPQMVNLDLIDGISFTKGCYTGQEIVARMKYLGRVKRRMLRFATAAAPPEAGSPVFAARGTVGQVVSSAPAGTGSEFLAVVSLDDLPGPFFLDESMTLPVCRLDLPYAIPA